MTLCAFSSLRHIVHLGIAIHSVSDAPEEAIAVLCHALELEAALREALLKLLLARRLRRLVDERVTHLVVRVDGLICCGMRYVVRVVQLRASGPG